MGQCTVQSLVLSLTCFLHMAGCHILLSHALRYRMEAVCCHQANQLPGWRLALPYSDLPGQ